MTDHTVEIIAPDGDVILLVGTEDKQRHQVSSATLSSISPVFKALLGPHFREGQQPRSSSNPVSISLPDDESDDMHRLCQIAHLKFEEGLESLYCDDILQLAVLVDKYDCSALLQPQSAGIFLSWLLNHPPGHVSFTPVSIWRIALAAFLMRSMQAFRDATEKIIVHTTAGPPPSISKSSPCLALNVIAAIENKRNTARLSICSDIPKLGIPKCSKGCNNKDAEFMQGLANACGIPFWPPNFSSESLPLSEVFDKLERIAVVTRSSWSCMHDRRVSSVTKAEFHALVGGYDCPILCQPANHNTDSASKPSRRCTPSEISAASTNVVMSLKQEEATVLAADGDVVLIVGRTAKPANGKIQSIRVSSSNLSIISPVFQVLFSPRFQEGQQPRDSGHPVEIELPEDNSAAMLRLCQMAHFQPVNIVETYFKKNASRSASLLCDIAKVMDKYDCVEPLKLQSTGLLLSWLESPLPPGTDSVDLNSLLFITAASLLMHCAQAFAIVTSRIIFRTTIKINYAPWAELIPLNVIEGTRSAAWQHFCFGLPELGIPKCPEWSNKCDNKDALFMQRLADAFNLPFWPPHMEKGMTLPRLLDRTRDMVAVPRSRPTCSHTHSKTEVSAEAFRKFADQITERSQTLCFGCIRGIHLPGVNCRKHIWSLCEGAEIEDS
ncbi:putative SKP1/BTB/POZ domain superfamily protein [Septoria linicola]|nr:putative SKP1/BTB/POZ domain superfamily protein [Septoria linicola]